MNDMELRPLSLGELLDCGFQIYKRHVWVFVGISAIPSLFAIPMSFVAITEQGSPIPFSRIMAQRPSSFSYANLVVVLCFWLVDSLALGASTHAVAEGYLGLKPTVLGAWRWVRHISWRLLGLVVNIGVRVILVFAAAVFVAALIGFFGVTLMSGSHVPKEPAIMAIAILAILLGVTPSVYLILRYAVCVPALLIERLPVTASIRRSVQLTKGCRWRMFFALVLPLILSYAGTAIFQGPFWIAAALVAPHGNAPYWIDFGAATSMAIGRSLTSPFFMIVLVLCYYDLRIRKEAFDLQYMMASLDSPAAAAGTVSPA